MKWLIFLIILSCCHLSMAQNFDLNNIRQLYLQATDNRENCKQLLQLTMSDNADTNPLKYGYYAVAKILYSQFLFNPISKYSQFNQGKQMLEQVISLHPNNLELRFLRYCVQLNAPSFLNYKQNIMADKILINQHIWNESKDLQSFINPILQSL